MELHRVIKSDARRALRGCWGRSLAALMVLFLAYLAVTVAESVFLFVFDESEAAINIFSIANADLNAVIITGAAALAFFILMPALRLGYLKLHLALAGGGDDSVSAVFDMFSSFGAFVKSIVFTFCLSLRYIICTVLALVPGSILFYLAKTYIPEQNKTVHILKISACCIGIALMMLCLALAFIYSRRWFVSPYYFVSGRKIHESFRLSVKATKGLRTQITVFIFSFLGWAILNVFMLPIFWSLPYYSVARAIYAKYLMAKLEHVPAKDIFEDDFVTEEPEKDEGSAL